MQLAHLNRSPGGQKTKPCHFFILTSVVNTYCGVLFFHLWFLKL